MAARLRPIAEDGERDLYVWGREAKMPRKVRDLVRDLERAGFANRGGKGSHRNFIHPSVPEPVTITGHDGDDAKYYQERAVRQALEEARQ